MKELREEQGERGQGRAKGEAGFKESAKRGAEVKGIKTGFDLGFLLKGYG